MARGRGRSRGTEEESTRSSRSLVVDDGLAQMEEDDRIPEGDGYEIQVTEIRVGDSGWAQARAKIVGSEDEELIGRPAGSCALMNLETGQKTGIRQIMIAKHWEFLPEDENGERSLAALKGERFNASITHKDNFTNWSPILTSEDYDWRDSVRDNGAGAAPKGRSKKKAGGKRRR